MNLKDLITWDEAEYGDEGEVFFEAMEEFGFKEVTETQYGYKGRWSTQVSQVYKRVSDETYWKFSWQEGNTECQEVDFELDVEQVYPKQVTKTIYVSKQ